VIVLDASAVAELLIRTAAGSRVAARIERASSLHAPGLIDLEVLQVLRRYRTIGRLTRERGGQAVTDLHDLPLRRYPHDPFLFRIWQLKDNLTAYDAAYIALAEALGAPLVTRDARLAGVPGTRAVVEVL